MANTLKFGNGEWYGKKDTILAYNDENSNYKPLPFDFSRDSKATVINKDGLIEEVGSGQPRIDYKDDSKGALLLEPSRTNLITQSESFANSYWTKSGASIQADPSTAGSEEVTNGSFDSNITGWSAKSCTIAWDSGKLKADNSSGNNSGGAFQNIGLVTGKTYKMTATMQLLTGSSNGTFTLFTSTSSGTGQTQVYTGSTLVVGGAAVTETFYFTSGSGDVSIQFSCDEINATYTIDNVSVKEVQGFTSPDGTNNAYKLVEGTNNGNHLIYSAFVSGSSGNNYTTSFFVKAAERTWCKILNYGGTQVFFDLENGVVGTETNASGKIEALSNDWYKISMTYVSQSSERAYLYIAEDDNDNSYQGNGTSGIYVFGSQVEQGSYSTSLIKTQGTIQTRLADTCSQTPPDGVIGQTEGTIFAEFKIPETETPSFFSISNGSSVNRIIFGYYNGNLTYFVNSSTGSFFTTGIIDNSPVVGQTYKIAVAYKSNDFKIYKNGINTNTETTFTVPSSLTVIDNQGGTGISQYIFAKVKQFSLYNTRLSNSELAALTQV